MKYGLLTVLLVLVAVGAYAMSGNGLGETHCWRYKITIEIETPEGVKSGSAVREACLTPFQGYNPSIADFKQKVVGEAVAVDMGRQKILFAIMDQDGSILDIEHAFQGPKLHSQEGIEYYSTLAVGSKASLPEKYWPQMVAFDDLSDPKTVKNVWSVEFERPVTFSPYHITDNLEEVFGKGVKIADVSIEITSEPVTWGIEEYLNWLPSRSQISGYLGSSVNQPYIDPTKTYFNGIEFSRGKFWLIKQ